MELIDPDLRDARAAGLLILPTPGLSRPVELQGRVLRYDPSTPAPERAAKIAAVLGGDGPGGRALGASSPEL